MSRTPRRSRESKRSIYIGCEGKTEVRYFQGIRDIVHNNPKYALKIEVPEIIHGMQQDPLGLVTTADKIRIEDGFDEAWAVFDKDRPVDTRAITQAFQYAREHDVQICYSSIAFEHWVLLHFEKNQTAFGRSDCESRGETCVCNGTICLCRYLRNHYLPAYQKASYLLYSVLSPYTNIAIENAAWLKQECRENLSETLHIQEPFTLNPYSDVDILVQRLLNLEKIIFGAPNQTFTISNLRLNITRRNNNSLAVLITNGRGVTFVLNGHSDIKVKTADGTLHPHNIDTALLIEPDHSGTAYLTFPTAPQQESFEFRFTDSGETLIVPLLR